MDTNYLLKLFDISGKVAVVTGGGGVLCSAISKSLAKCGARVAVLDLFPQAAQKVVDEIKAEGGEAIAVGCDVLDKKSIEDAASVILKEYHQVDILINGAGGNKKQASTSADQPFFDLPTDAVQWVFNLNFIGTLLPSQVFGKLMAAQKSGNIINISSMNSFRPLTRVPGLFRCQSRDQQLYPMVGSPYQSGIFPQYSRQCDRTRFLPDRAKQVPDDRRKNR